MIPGYGSSPRIEAGVKGGAAMNAPLERLVRIVDRHGQTHYVRPSMVLRIFGRPKQVAKKYGPTAVILSNGNGELGGIEGDWSPDEVAKELGLRRDPTDDIPAKEVQP